MDPAVKGIPLDSEDLIPVLTEIAVKHFHGTVNPEFAADQAAWEKACSRHAPHASRAFPVISREPPHNLPLTTARSRQARDEQGGVVPKTVEYAPKAGTAQKVSGNGLERRFW